MILFTRLVRAAILLVWVGFLVIIATLAWDGRAPDTLEWIASSIPFSARRWCMNPA